MRTLRISSSKCRLPGACRSLLTIWMWIAVAIFESQHSVWLEFDQLVTPELFFWGVLFFRSGARAGKQLGLENRDGISVILPNIFCALLQSCS
jgi:hypothetical protein